MNSLPKACKGKSLVLKTTLRKTAVIIGLFLLVTVSVIVGYRFTQAQLLQTAQEEDVVQQKTALYPVRIITQEGSYLIRAELADTPEKLALGLMGRTELAPDHGMLFLFPSERDVSFWMRNTLIPLDLIYIAKDGVINHIHPMAQPLDETQLPSKGGKVIAVLEIAGGQAAAKNIRVGDKVETTLLHMTLKGETE